MLHFLHRCYNLLHWCYTWTALLLANQNRVIFSCILLRMIYKQVHLYIDYIDSVVTSSITPLCYYKVGYIAKSRINYRWTKLCLLCEDHRSRSPCTRNSWRDSVPAGKAVLSRARFPQFSVQFAVQSEIKALAGKTYRHKTFKVGTQEGLFPATSPLKSLHVGTGRRDLSHEQFTRSFLRDKSQGLVAKIQTNLNSWD